MVILEKETNIMDNGAIKSLVSCIGAICEIAGLLRDNLINNGFTRKETMAIVKSFIVNAFTDKGE